jgi:predicted protein tyrosine phosphatase
MALPKTFFLKLSQEPENEARLIDRAHVISINNSTPGDLCPLSAAAIATGKVLVLRFDDISYPVSGKVLMDRSHANDVSDFIQGVPAGGLLLVHCTFGVCRSGAVAEALDIHINGCEHSASFYGDNPYILPNSHVRQVLLERFGVPLALSGEIIANAPYNNFEFDNCDVFYSNPLREFMV